VKTVILDDDPTGTQSASGVTVLLEHDTNLIAAALGDADSVYIQTNTRAIDAAAAAALVRRIRIEADLAGERIGHDIHFVLRGDSTLRGHVFEETAEFLEPDAVILFVPAFPAGGRTTDGGVHHVAIDGVQYPADRTEYAEDPVFPFSTAVLTEYVREKSGRAARSLDLAAVRQPGALAAALAEAPAGSVLCPDVETDEDIFLIAEEVRAAIAGGVDLVVRSAAPLAAALAGVTSNGLLPAPLTVRPGRTLLVCGSHTVGATRQLERISGFFSTPRTIATNAALQDPGTAGRAVAESLRADLDQTSVALLMSERARSAEHNTLDHGERVMASLTAAMEELRDEVDVVIAKGGITSAEVVRTGLGARRATVRGQVLAGISVWDVETPTGRPLLYVVVPGNVGDDNTLADILAAVGHPATGGK